MKKRRRIEITTFRSRTTMTVRNQGLLFEPPRDGPTTTPALATLPKAKEIDLKPRLVAQLPRSDLSTIKLTQRKSSEGEQ